MKLVFRLLTWSPLPAKIMTPTVDVKDDRRNHPIQQEAKVTVLQIANMELLLFIMYST
jgi:hypothetical protein